MWEIPFSKGANQGFSELLEVSGHVFSIGCSYAALVLGPGPATMVQTVHGLQAQTTGSSSAAYTGGILLSPGLPPRPLQSWERQAPLAVHAYSPELTPHFGQQIDSSFLPCMHSHPVSRLGREYPRGQVSLCLTPSGGQFSNSPWSWLSLLLHITPFPSLLLPWICTPEKSSGT